MISPEQLRSFPVSNQSRAIELEPQRALPRGYDQQIINRIVEMISQVATDCYGKNTFVEPFEKLRSADPMLLDELRKASESSDTWELRELLLEASELNRRIVEYNGSPSNEHAQDVMQSAGTLGEVVQKIDKIKNDKAKHEVIISSSKHIKEGKHPIVALLLTQADRLPHNTYVDAVCKELLENGNPHPFADLSEFVSQKDYSKFLRNAARRASEGFKLVSRQDITGFIEAHWPKGNWPTTQPSPTPGKGKPPQSPA